MRMCRRIFVPMLVVVVCGALGSFCSGQDLPPCPEISIPRCDTAPVIDGDLGDVCWRNAAPIETFYLLGGVKTTDAVSVKTVRDDMWLYFAFDIKLPNTEAMSPMSTEHDGNLSYDDSVELFFDPGTDGETYLHYMLGATNVRAERLCPNRGQSKDMTWDEPWRSATRIGKTGWQAEMAVPLSVLAAQGDLSKAKMNIGATRVIFTLGHMNVKIGVNRESSSWSAVKSRFHNPDRFGVVKGLEGVSKPREPLLVSTQKVKTGRYTADAGGKFSYDVQGELRSFTGQAGNIQLTIEDIPVVGSSETLRQEVSIAKAGVVPFNFKVPVKAFGARSAKLRLLDPANGEILQELTLRDMSDLSLMRSYARRSYFTTEENAEVVCEIGLPESELAGAVLVAKDASGVEAARATDIQPRSILPLPLKGMQNGSHKISVELQRKTGGTLIRQEVEIVKRAPKPGCEWKIDWADKTLLNNGVPFFPFGVMPFGLKNQDELAKDIADAGFNSIVRWARVPVEDVDQLEEVASKYGLYIIENPPYYRVEPKPGDEPPKPEPGMTWQEQTILQFDWNMSHIFLPGAKKVMNHPSVIAWYLWDEPQGTDRMADCLSRFHDKLNELDGYHPTEVLYIPPVPEGQMFSKSCEILGIDPYWVPGAGAGDMGNPNRVGKQTWLARRRADQDLKLAWVTPCADYFSGSRMRIITADEQRVQTYLALIHGAKGLLYFRYPFLHQSTHDAFKQLGAEMKTLGPACAAGDITQTIKYTPVDFDPINNGFPDVQAALKRNPDGGFLLLAANWRAYPVEVSFALSALGQSGNVKILFGGKGERKVENGRFSDTIAAMDTRVYAFAESGAVKTPVSIAVDVKPLTEKTDPLYSAVAFPDSGVPGKRNLVRNPGFEDCSLLGMPDYNSFWNLPYPANLWRIGDSRGVNTIGLDTEKPYEGKNCLRIDGGTMRFILAPKIDKTTKFVFSAWMRGAPGSTAKFQGPGMDSKMVCKPTNDWQRFHQVIEVKPNADCFYGVRCSNGPVWIDAIQFEKGSELTDYEK